MGWQDLLAPEGGEKKILPWTGGKQVHSLDRTWDIKGRRPPEHGWYLFEVTGGRKATLVGKDPQMADPDFGEGKTLRGYLVGDRFIKDGAAVVPDPTKLVEQTEPVFCVEPGMDRFTRATVLRDLSGALVYLRQEWPDGPEAAVLAAFQDREGSVTHLPGVTPALDLAFRWISHQRLRAEERAREAERIRLEEEARLESEEKLREAMKSVGTGAGRRDLAQRDFAAAARAALAISGAELLDCRESYTKNEMVVQYRYRNRRLECTCDRRTLRIIDSGVCLDDHHGTKGDTYFTLESLPAVIQEAMNLGKLVVWRHAPGDRDNRYNDDYDEDDY